MTGSERLRTGLLLFPGITPLDAAGPYEVLARAPELDVLLIAKTKGETRSELGLALLADEDFASAPDLDILCVPGGKGIIEAASDADTIDFLKRQGAKARYVTSVCTGALLAGAAGLLKGYRATTHWLSLDLLPLVGAIPVNERVVKDRNRITSAGITAGIDLALALVGEISGERQAAEIELMLQYDPAPPFKSGSPAIAEATLVQAVSAERHALQDERRAFFAMLDM
ncbi:MAG: DJ-1/PfpI family protein [Actinomycetota bacterium]